MTIEIARRPARRLAGRLPSVNRRLIVSFAILACYLAIAVLAPVLPIAGYAAMDRDAALAPPSITHLLGTDHLGRDILARSAYAVRASLSIAGIAVVVSTMLGVTLGLVAGYARGATDTIISRFIDALLAFPTLLLAIGITAVISPGAVTVALALGIVGVPQMARIVRAATLVERERQYVDAARNIGASAARIAILHVLPNVWAQVVVQGAVFAVTAVLTEAGLSFLGFGIQVPEPSLGSMLEEARRYLGRAPWFGIVPGLILSVLVLGLNLMADEIRDRLDPRTSRGEKR